MLENEKKGENNSSIYNYKLIDRINIKYTNFYWKWVDIFSCRLCKIADRYNKNIAKEYIQEFKMFDIHNAKNILHIGCGSYPITAMTLYNLNGGNITGLDKSEKAVKRARKIINHRKYHDRIRIENGNGKNFSLDKFDTIIVSGCAIPKIKILKNLFEKANSKTRIIVRESINLSNVVSQYIYDSKHLVEIKNHMSNKPNEKGGWESYLIVKK